MKILLCAPYDGHSHTYLRKALMHLGHEVTSFDYRAAAENNGTSYMNQRIMRLSHFADATVILKGENISTETIKTVKALLWNMDSWYSMDPALLSSAKAAKAFFTPSDGLIPEYTKKGIAAHYLPEAADLEFHHPIELTSEDAARYGSDISFVGTVDEVEGRDIWLNRIGEHFPDGLKIWGSFPGMKSLHWHQRCRAGYGPTEDHVHNMVVSASKINLDRTRTPEIAGAISARVYRTMAARGLVLMVQQTDLEKYISPQSVATYHSDSECIERISHYLDDPDEAAKVAEHGYQEVLERHTWKQRAMELMKFA